MTWTPESELAKELGLTRTQMTDLRREHLKYGYWRRAKKKGRAILISEKGIERLKAILESRAQSETVNSQTLVTHPIPQKLLLSVTRIPMNPYILYARTNGDNQEYTVRVQSNLVYSLHDKLYAIPDNTYKNIWSQTGPKPRFRGDGHYQHYFV